VSGEPLVIGSRSAEATERAGEALARLVEPGDVVSLCGDLGAGKTCLAKGVARGMGVEEPVTSPTFNILLVHPGRALTLFHLDLYRLEDADELEDIDFRGTLESGGVSLIEWGDRFPEALPDDHLSVEISFAGETSRRLCLRPTGPRAMALARAWVAAAGDAAGGAA